MCFNKKLNKVEKGVTQARPAIGLVFQTMFRAGSAPKPKLGISVRISVFDDITPRVFGPVHSV